MEVVKNQIDEINAVLTVNIKKEDIDEKVNQTLADYRRKAKVPGFRPGKVPMGMIRKMYANSVIAEELNNMVSQSLFDYIQKEQINILGDPLPNENQAQIDIDNQNEFSFLFDVGISPDFELNLSKRDKVTEYSIKVDKKMIDSHIENYQRRHGHFEDAAKISEESRVFVEIFEINQEGEIVENGIRNQNASIFVNVIKDEDTKKTIIGAEIGKTIDFDVKKAFENETEISSLLGIDKKDVANLNPNFRITINEIKDFVKAELDKELFDKVFGKDSVADYAEFELKVIEAIKETLSSETSMLLFFEIKEKVVKKFNNDLPEAFLKRWLRATNKDISEEQLEKEFPMFIEDLRWTLIKNKIGKDIELKITEEDLLEVVKKSLMEQMRKYGISQMPNDSLTNYAKEMIQKEEERKKAGETVLNDKVIEFVKETVKIDSKEVTVDELNAIIEEKFKQ